MRHRLFRLSIIFLLFLQAGFLALGKPVVTAGQDRPDDLADGRFGINNVNKYETIDGRAEYRYGRAIALGAVGNRWVLWWHDVEKCNPSRWDWAVYDRLVDGDLGHGMEPLIILQGVPVCYQKKEGARVVPVRLDQPIFRDAAEVPTHDPRRAAPGEAGINPYNPWALYVYRAVKRYGRQVRYWQVWNEQNIFYWPDTPEAYARLAEVAYFAARHAWPNVRLVMGGLSDVRPHGPEAVRLTRRLFKALDRPSVKYPAFKYTDYFYAYATHEYNAPWQTVEFTDWVLSHFTAAKAIWVTETGADMYFLHTEAQRATAILQTLVYLLAVGPEHSVERFFHFQLDNSNECGLLTGGPSHDSQKRPAYTALLQLQTFVGNASPKSPALYDPAPDQHSKDHQEVYFTSPHFAKVTVLWSTVPVNEITVSVVPEYPHGEAILFWQDGITDKISPVDGTLRIRLPPALDRAVGGKTVFVLENPNFPDSDGDGIPDVQECLGPEQRNCPDTDRDKTPDHLDSDSDNDGLADALEAKCAPDVENVTFPCDSNGDGRPDYRQVDKEADD